jgi:hypothetical protein
MFLGVTWERSNTLKRLEKVNILRRLRKCKSLKIKRKVNILKSMEKVNILKRLVNKKSNDFNGGRSWGYKGVAGAKCHRG